MWPFSPTELYKTQLVVFVAGKPLSNPAFADSVSKYLPWYLQVLCDSYLLGSDPMQSKCRDNIANTD